MLISGGKVIAIDEINHDNTLSGDGLFNPLGVNIDAIGKPLTYSGSKSVADINELDNIKVGTVYTISGEPGTITAGNFDVIQGDEIAWGGDPAQWFNIGKDKVNSWKQWSEEHESTGTEDAVYIGKGNDVNNNITAIGDNNTGRCFSNVKILGNKNNVGTNQVWDTTIIGNENKPSSGANDYSYKGKIFGDNNSGASNSTIVGNSNKVINGAFFKTIVGGGNTVETDNETYIIGANNKALGTSNKPSYVFGYNNSASGGFAIGVKNEVKFGSTYNDSVAIGSENKVYDYALGIGERNSAFKYGISIGTNNSSDNGGVSIGKYNNANDGGYAIGHQASATLGALAISENGGAFADNGSISIGDNSAYASCGSITLGRNGVSSKNDSYTLGSCGLYALNHSTTIGNGLSAIDAGFAIGVADSNGGGKAEGGMIITMTNRSFKGGYHDNSGNWIVEDWGIVTSSDSVTCLSGKKYINDEGEIVYTGIPFTANEKWMPFAYNGGITIGRAASSNRGIAISPKWTNINTGTILGTSANNESVAIGENVIATNGSLVLGKNGMSATDASIGIGRMGVARGASVLMSNDLDGGNKTPFSGKLWAYYDETEEKYKPFDRYDSVTYKNYQTIQNKIYNENTSAFESLYSNYPTKIYILFLNTWDGSIGYITSGGVSWSRQYFSGYYDENNNFIKVNSQSEVPSSATLIQAFSANVPAAFDYIGNNIFTTSLSGSTGYSNYSDNPYTRSTIINGYILCQDSQYNDHLYESCLNRNNTNNSSLYNFLKQYEHLSGYVDENALNGMYYEDIKYDAETDTIFNTTDNIVDYWIINGQKVYPKDISEQTFIDLDEERTYSDANSVGIGMGLSSFGTSIAINAGTEAYPRYSEYSNPMYCRSATIGNMLTGNTNYTAYLSNSYSANKEIKSKDSIVTAVGKSIVLGADGKNISAGGNSIAIGNHDINVTGKSVGIGNNIYSFNQSIVINQNAFGRTPSAIQQSLVIGGGGSWAQNNSFIFGECNSANNNAYVFGQGNSANGRTFAFGEANYIATGKSFALGYSNYINGSTEVCTIGYRNYANGGSMQNVIMGYDNYMSVGGYALHLIGNRNSASCRSIYGSVVGNWNMLSHGNSLLAIHGDNNSAFGSLGEANILGHYNVVGGGGNRISVIGYENGRNAPGAYRSYDGIVFGNGNNWNGGSFRGSIIGLNNNISGISYTDMSILGNDNFVSADENGIILGNSNYINSYNGSLNSTRNIIIGVSNTASGYASMNSVLLGYSNRVYYGRNIAIGDYNYAGNQSFLLGYCNTAVNGDNIGFGAYNDTEYESIGIGKNNNTYGHSITLGWYNTSVKSDGGGYSYAHSIMLGYSNSSNNTRQNLTYKNVDIYNLVKYPQETVDEITTRYQTAISNARTNSAVLFSVDAYNINWNSEDINIAPPLYTYDSTYNVISPYDYYDEKSYIILPYSAISDVHNAYNRGDIPEEVAARYKFINDTTWNNIINLVNNRATLLPIYTEYSAASSQYHELTSTNNSYTATENSISTETNSLVVGSNNSAAHHNSYLFGSYNQSFSSLINSGSDDGFVYAFGLGNIVCRNYDMAIGYGSVASGGENIAIGTKQNYYSPIQNAKAIGYRNISIYSEVEGISNFAYNSKIVSDYGDEYNYNIKRYTNNIIYHSNISGLSGVHKNFIFGCYSGYNNEYPGIIELRYTDNSFILDSNNISYLSAHHSFIFGNNYYSTDKPISNSVFDYTLFGFGQNKAIRLSAANAIIGGGNGEYTKSNISNAIVWNSRADYSTVSNSLIIGTNVNYGDNGGSIIVSDPSYSWSTSDSYINVVENQHKSIIIGDNKLLGNNYNYLNFVLGDGNSINSNTNYYKNFIMGSTNQLTGNHYFNNNSIFGDENIIGTASFTHVYGTKNIVESGGYNTIFGLNNKLGNSAYQIYSADSNQIRQNSYTNSSVRLELSNSERAYGIVLATTKEIYGYSATYETYKPFFVYQYRDNARDTWHDRDRDYTGNWYKLHSFSNAGIVNGWGLNNHLVLTDKAAANDNFYFTIEYLSWWSYGSSRYLYDMITYEMYDNLPDTGKALYSNTLTSGGVSFRYRSLNWRDDTACDCTKNIYKLVRIPYNGVKLQHIEIIPLSTITSATDGSQLDSVAVTSQNSDFDNGPLMFMDCSHNELTSTYYTRTLTAKLGISSHFNNKSYLKSDTEYPYVWNVYYPDNYRICTESNFVFGKDNIFTEYTPTGEFDNEYNEYRHNNVIGSHNILNSNEIFFTTVIGQNNNINASGYVTNSFIYGTNNNLVTKPGSPVSSTFGFIYGQNNIQIDGVQAVSFGSDTTAYGDLSMVFGDFTMAKKHQFVIGKFNDYNSTPGVERENYSINYEIGYYDSNYHYYSDVITYDSTLSAYTAAPQYFDRKDINSGVLFSIGNGYMDIYDPNTNIVNISSISYNTISLDTNKAYKRRNAMIVSADGTVSAKRFIEADPALTITGGDFVTVTENQQNNLLTIDLETSLGQMITELSGVLTAKPSTGRHILGVDNGTLTWLEVNQ